ncbi:TPA: hypothetical protein H1Q11_000601 [Salmonella enterica]|nr:hypothetical protein [Salmonella enterica]
MTTITREQQKQILIDTANHVISRDNTSPYSENLRELARIALASLDADQPVPEEIPKGLAGQIVWLLAHNIGDKLLAQKIWNACRAAMLQANQRDLSQPVDPQVAEYEQIMLRAGWVMVPVEPTDEMIAAAMECEDVLFNSDGSFCVQFREIYCAMVDAALALNKGEY